MPKYWKALPSYEVNRIREHQQDILASRSDSGYDQIKSMMRTELDAMMADIIPDPYEWEKRKFFRKHKDDYNFGYLVKEKQ